MPHNALWAWPGLRRTARRRSQRYLQPRRRTRCLCFFDLCVTICVPFGLFRTAMYNLYVSLSVCRIDVYRACVCARLCARARVCVHAPAAGVSDRERGCGRRLPRRLAHDIVAADGDRAQGACRGTRSAAHTHAHARTQARMHPHARTRTRALTHTLRHTTHTRTHARMQVSRWADAYTGKGYATDACGTVDATSLKYSVRARPQGTLPGPYILGHNKHMNTCDI